MTMYFVLQQRGYNPKNKLEEAAQKMAANKNQLLVAKEELPQFFDDIEERVVALNKYFPRCTPLVCTHEEAYGDKEEYTISCGSVFNFHLYKVRNS